MNSRRVKRKGLPSGVCGEQLACKTFPRHSRTIQVMRYLLALILALPLCAQTPDQLEAHGAVVTAATYLGKSAVRVDAQRNAANGDSFAIVKGSRFRNGSIEVDLAGKPGAAADPTARGFIGLAFRVQGDRYEYIYLRPTNGRADDTVLLARRIASTSTLSYAVRVEPTLREAALRSVRKVIQQHFGALLPTGITARVSTYRSRREAVFKSQRAALGLFAGITLAVVAVTVIGIMGLTGFWVQKRTRQIGIRRALGARRADILRYFLAENALIVSIGVAIGMLLAYLGNALLMHYYELARLPWSWLPIGAVVMLLLGQLAVLGPALRAAAVPPVVATRSV